MSAIYEAIGRAVVKLAWVRYGRQIRLAVALGTASVVLGVYLAARGGVREG